MRRDQLELDLSWGDRHGTTTLQPDGTATLPLVIAAITGTAPRLAVLGGGKLSGQVLGTGVHDRVRDHDRQRR
ncbi:MAG: hypothetical protein ABJE66_09230 [Deltaproteobacteria bacterium]